MFYVRLGVPQRCQVPIPHRRLRGWGKAHLYPVPRCTQILASGKRRSLFLVAAFKTPLGKTDETDLEWGEPTGAKGIPFEAAERGEPREQPQPKGAAE